MAKPLKLSRRRFIAGVAAALVLCSCYVAHWWWRYVRARDPSTLIRAIVERHARGMQIASADIDRFASDFGPELMGFTGNSAAWAGILAPAYRMLDLLAWSETLGSQLRLLEDHVMTRFLMSTDFFFNGADSGKPVRYLVLYDPLKHPCRGLLLQ